MAVVLLLASILAWRTEPRLAAQGEQGSVARHAEAAQQAQRAGDFATAIQEWTAVARLLPDRADVQSNLGLAYFFHQQPTQALAAFDKALRLDPTLVAPLIFSGIAHYTRSRPARAIPLLERAVALSPADPLAHTWLAHSYAAQGRLTNAVEQFTIASDRAPQDVDIWFGLGQAYLQLGRQAVRRLTELAPAGARIAQLSGDLWLLRGEPRNALTLYEQALARRPDLPEVRQIVAQLRERLPASPAPRAESPGSQAEPTPTPLGDLMPPRAASADPASPEDAQYLAATDARDRAQRAFERISALAPDSSRAHQVLAESLEAEERPNDAVAEYRTVLRLKPDVAGVHLAIGNLLMSEGRAAEALEDYRAELRVRPESAEVYYRMGRALVVLGQTDDAETALTRALALGDAPAATHRELGRLALTRGKPADAAKALSTYIAIAPNDAAAHYLLMQARRALGDTAAADRHYADYERLSARDKQESSLTGALSAFGRDRTPEP